MEGGRACAVIAIWMPLAFIAGAVIGFVVGLLIKRQGFAGYALKQGISLAAIAARRDRECPGNAPPDHRRRRADELDHDVDAVLSGGITDLLHGIARGRRNRDRAKCCGRSEFGWIDLDDVMAPLSKARASGEAE